MNETLRRAMFRARISEEDVASQLAVDPKTVRRWIEGRVPYPRHRWALAAILHSHEHDLWPGLVHDAETSSIPSDIVAVYPTDGQSPARSGISSSARRGTKSASSPTAACSSPRTPGCSTSSQQGQGAESLSGSRSVTPIARTSPSAERRKASMTR